ncbi:MAG: c-type cytochrome [Methylococcales bacterium]|nr:c-type cytochrome [Methylococcales bacterium]MBT7445737.1 c-type cytochrome [Methylococcales bacterium]
MKNVINTIAIAGLLAVSGSAIAGDAAAGKAKAAACMACHGVNGEGNAAMLAPKLAGQLENYLVSSIKAFKAGTRSNPMMSPMAAPLTDADIANLAAYYSSIK